MDPFTKPAHIQGSAEWLAHRKNHLGASDAAIVMGVSPWNTPLQLWEQKLGYSQGPSETPAMRRGTEMEPFARLAFENETGIEVFPQVVYHPDHPFMMASLDGLSLDRKTAVEIKCPGASAHATAIAGKVPKYYMPQLQHQLACLSLDMLYYFSFDGEKGVNIEVQRDDEYIKALIEAESSFWGMVKTRTPPAPTNRDYEERSGAKWVAIEAELSSLQEEMSGLEKQMLSIVERKSVLKAELIADAGGRSCRCGSLTLGRSFPKGRIDYSEIPELKGVDLDQYRKEAKETWRLTCSRSV